MISTKNVKDPESVSGSGGGLKPILSAGNYFVAIRGIELRKDKNWEKYGDKLVLRLETEPIPGLKGLPLDKAKPELGTHTGQIGYVSYSRWGFSDYTAPDNSVFTRIDSLLVALKTICKELGILEWFDNANEKYATIEDFVVAFNLEAPYKNIFFHAALYGREYLNGTYLNQDLYFPKFDRVLGKPFSLNKEKVITFYESTGIERLTNKAAQTTATNTGIKLEPMDTSKVGKTSDDLPTKITPSSQAEANFLNDGKKAETQTNAEFLAELNSGNPPEETTDIITGDPNEKMPWDN